MSTAPIRVLVVDDSPVVRSMIRARIGRDPRIRIVGEAVNGEEAIRQITALRPEVVTLDVEMPRMSGLEVLERIGGRVPVSFVMCSTLTQAGARTTFEALKKGAFDYVAKPDTAGVIRNADFHAELLRKICAAAAARGKLRRTLSPITPPVSRLETPAEARGWVVGIGISCGGPQTLIRVLPLFPADFAPILITQHMPPGFTAALADQLDRICPMRVKEAVEGEAVTPGTIYIAPGTHHLCLSRGVGGPRVRLSDGPKVSGHRPSVDVMFESLAKICGRRSVGVIMTGMGSDGATGVRTLHAAGAWLIGQDPESSLVYGMPKAAADTGFLDEAASMLDIPGRTVRKIASGVRKNSVAAR